MFRVNVGRNFYNFFRNYDASAIQKCSVSYIQGQSPEPRIREYFYYIDHQGQVREICIIHFTRTYSAKTSSNASFNWPHYFRPKVYEVRLGD